jgi:hypothetical protein
MKLKQEQHDRLEWQLNNLIGCELIKYKNSKHFTLDSFNPKKPDQIGRKIACEIINDCAHKVFPSDDKKRKEFKYYIDKNFNFKGPYNWSHIKGSAE